MISQCPNCQTRFKVSRAQLQAAKGTVRCGACSTRFDAIANEARPTSPAGSASGKNSDSDQITKQWFSELLSAGDNPETGTSPTEATQQTSDDPLQNIAAQPIELAQPGNAKRRAGTLMGWAGCLALFLLLFAQWQLASQTPATGTGTGWKRYLYAACDYLHCKPADISGLVKVTSLRITPHPRQAEALQIDASILNTAGPGAGNQFQQSRRDIGCLPGVPAS